MYSTIIIVFQRLHIPTSLGYLCAAGHWFSFNYSTGVFHELV